MTSDSNPAVPQERKAIMLVLGLGVLFFVLLTPLVGLYSATGVLVGALIGAANLWVLTKAVRAFLQGDGQAQWGVAALLKFSVLLVVLYLLFRAGAVEGLPLVIGLGALPLGILLSQFGANQNSSEDHTRAGTQ